MVKWVLPFFARGAPLNDEVGLGADRRRGLRKFESRQICKPLNSRLGGQFNRFKKTTDVYKEKQK